MPMRRVLWYDECHKYLWISIVSMDSGNPCMTCNKYAISEITNPQSYYDDQRFVPTNFVRNAQTHR